MPLLMKEVRIRPGFAASASLRAIVRVVFKSCPVAVYVPAKFALASASAWHSNAGMIVSVMRSARIGVTIVRWGSELVPRTVKPTPKLGMRAM